MIKGTDEVDWSKLVSQYSGKWVALDIDETTVIASGSSAKLALEKAQSKGFTKPYLLKVPQQVTSFVGSSHLQV